MAPTRCSSPLIIFLALLWICSSMSMSFLCWGPQSWTQYSRWGLTRAERRGRITSHDLLAMLLLMQPRIQLAFWAASAHYWLMFSFASANTPKPFLTGLLSIHSFPSLYLCVGLPQSMCRTLHLALLNFMTFAQAHLSSLSRCLWMAFFPSCMLTTPHTLGRWQTC